MSQQTHIISKEQFEEYNRLREWYVSVKESFDIVEVTPKKKRLTSIEKRKKKFDTMLAKSAKKSNAKFS